MAFYLVVSEIITTFASDKETNNNNLNTGGNSITSALIL